MRSFYIYAGGAGKAILHWVVRQFNDSSWGENALAECKRIMVIDAQDPEKMISANRFGNKNEKLRNLISSERISIGVGQGVGMQWPKIVNAASNKFEAISKDYELPFEASEHFHICHSGGGGTGCGTGPVFSKNLKLLNKKNDINEQIYITASIVLPNIDNEENLRVPNACSTIGFHSLSCDGILIYDLGHSKRVLQKNGPILPIDLKEQYWFADYSLAESHLMLTSLNKRTHAILADKDFEGADLGTLCRGLGSTCSLIAPCYAEYPADLLRDLSFEVLIRDLIVNRSAVEYSFDKSVTRLIIFCVFPSSFKDEMNKIRESVDPELIKGILPKIREEEKMLYYVNSNLETKKCIKMFALIVNPYMPRLFEMKNEFSQTLQDLKNQQGSKYVSDYQEGFELYNSHLEKVYDGCSSERMVS